MDLDVSKDNSNILDSVLSELNIVDVILENIGSTINKSKLKVTKEEQASLNKLISNIEGKCESLKAIIYVHGDLSHIFNNK